MSIIKDIKDFIDNLTEVIPSSSESVLKANDMNKIDDSSSRYRNRSKSIERVLEDERRDLDSALGECSKEIKSLRADEEGNINSDSLESSIDSASGRLDDMESSIAELIDLKNKWEERSNYIEEQYDKLVAKIEDHLDQLSGYLEELEGTVISESGHSIDQAARNIVSDIRLKEVLKTREATFKK